MPVLGADYLNVATIATFCRLDCVLGRLGYKRRRI